MATRNALVTRIILVMTALLLGACSTVWQKGAIAPSVTVEGVHTGAEALAYAPDSSLLASGGWDGHVAVWRPDHGEPIRKWKAHEGWVQGLAFLSDRIITGGFDSELRHWRLDGTLARKQNAGSPVTRLITHGTYIVTGHQDGVVRFWNRRDLSLVREFKIHRRWVTALASDPVHDTVASSGEDETVFILSLDDNPRRVSNPPRNVYSLTFSPDGATLFGGAWFDIYRWTLSDAGRAPSAIRTEHWGNIIALQYVQRAGGLATLSRTNDSSVLFVDPNTGVTIQHFERQSICGGALSLSPNGLRMATTGDDGIVRMWNLAASIAPPQKTARLD
ncbi:MAG: hypothetical protein AAF493_09095 [Pseudomonadota bacterium]